MSYDEKTLLTKEHKLSLDARERLSITGVEDVSGFDENIVMLTTSMGELTIRGENLHIDRIDLDVGQLEVQGRIQQLNYDESAPSGSVWSRLFG